MDDGLFALMMTAFRVQHGGPADVLRLAVADLDGRRLPDHGEALRRAAADVVAAPANTVRRAALGDALYRFCVVEAPHRPRARARGAPAGPAAVDGTALDVAALAAEAGAAATAWTDRADLR